MAVTAPVPPDWVGRWHQVAGIYDGSSATLVVDGVRVASQPCARTLERSAAPINVGRVADLHGQEHPGRISNGVFNRVRIFPRALTLDELMTSDPDLVRGATVWLELDEVRDGPGTARWGSGRATTGSSGRSPAASGTVAQLKKSPQPVLFEMLDAASARVRITNRHGFTDLSVFMTRWQVTDDERVVAEGALDLALPPGESREVTIPLGAVGHTPGTERRLLLSTRLALDAGWAAKGHEMRVGNSSRSAGARSCRRHTQLAPRRCLSNGTGRRSAISGRGFTYRIDKTTGRLASMRVDGPRLVAGAPQPSFWRAPVWNETESQWGGVPIVAQWRLAGLDRLVHTAGRVEARRDRDRWLSSRRISRLRPRAPTPIPDPG